MKTRELIEAIIDTNREDISISQYLQLELLLDIRDLLLEGQVEEYK